MSKISDRQMEILRALDRIGQPTEWGDVWDRVGWSDGSPAPLQMSNFDRTSNALMRRGLIALDDDNLVKLTDDGRALVELAKRERAAIAKLPDLTVDEIRADLRRAKGSE